MIFAGAWEQDSQVLRSKYIGCPASMMKDGSKLSWSTIKPRCSPSSFFVVGCALAARKAINNNDNYRYLGRPRDLSGKGILSVGPHQRSSQVLFDLDFPCCSAHAELFASRFLTSMMWFDITENASSPSLFWTASKTSRCRSTTCLRTSIDG